MSLKMSRINLRKRQRVKKNSHYTCQVCKLAKSSEELEVDHIIPSSRGGTDEYNNLQALCIDCHIKKTQTEWTTYSYKKKVSLTSPKERLEKLKNYLEQHKDKHIAEVSFLILNHNELSHYNYSTTTVSNLFNLVRGKKSSPREQYSLSFRKERDFLLSLVHERLGLSTRKLSEYLSERGFNMSYRQIANIYKEYLINNKKQGINPTDSSESTQKGDESSPNDTY